MSQVGACRGGKKTGWARGVSGRWCNNGAQPLAWSWDSSSPSHSLGKPFPASLLPSYRGVWREWGEEEADGPDGAVQAHWKEKNVDLSTVRWSNALAKRSQDWVARWLPACLPAARSCCRTPRCCPELCAWHGLCGPVPLLPLTGGLGRKTLLLLLHQRGFVVPRAAEMKLLVCSVAPGLFSPLARAVLPLFFYCMKNSKEQSVVLTLQLS